MVGDERTVKHAGKPLTDGRTDPKGLFESGLDGGKAQQSFVDIEGEKRGSTHGTAMLKVRRTCFRASGWS